MDYEKKIKLIAKNIEDLEIFSQLCQDAILSKDELFYDEKAKIIFLTFSRYCWEKTDLNNSKVNFRVISGLQIKNVQKVQYINFKYTSEINFLNLLAVSYENKKIRFYFSSLVEIILTVNDIFAILEDIDIPWPTKLNPIHNFD